MRQRWTIRLILILMLLWLAVSVEPVRAQTEPPPDMPPVPDRLAPPPTVYPPTQADDGAQVYYQVCMACHGDRGQGLTEEWRGALDPEDQNCWQSRCHATNHPPGGFLFPKSVPAVVSPAIPARFLTALDLHEYVKSKMPYQAPGSLSDEEYWQLTAFLTRANGFDPGQQPLDAGRAASVKLQAPTPGQQYKIRLLEWIGLAAGLILLAGLAAFLVKLTYQRVHR